MVRYATISALALGISNASPIAAPGSVPDTPKANAPMTNVNWTSLTSPELGDLPATYMANIALLSGFNASISTYSNATLNTTDPSSNSTTKVVKHDPFTPAGTVVGALIGGTVNNLANHAHKGLAHSACEFLAGSLGGVPGLLVGGAINNRLSNDDKDKTAEQKEWASKVNSTRKGNETTTNKGDNEIGDVKHTTTNNMISAIAGGVTGSLVSTGLSRAVCGSLLKAPLKALDKLLKENLDFRSSPAAQYIDNLLNRYAPSLIEGQLTDLGVPRGQAGLFGERVMDMIYTVGQSATTGADVMRVVQRNMVEQLSQASEVVGAGGVAPAVEAGLAQMANLPGAAGLLPPVSGTAPGGIAMQAIAQIGSHLSSLNREIASQLRDPGRPHPTQLDGVAEEVEELGKGFQDMHDAIQKAANPKDAVDHLKKAAGGMLKMPFLHHGSHGGEDEAKETKTKTVTKTHHTTQTKDTISTHHSTEAITKIVTQTQKTTSTDFTTSTSTTLQTLTRPTTQTILATSTVQMMEIHVESQTRIQTQTQTQTQTQAQTATKTATQTTTQTATLTITSTKTTTETQTSWTTQTILYTETPDPRLTVIWGTRTRLTDRHALQE